LLRLASLSAATVPTPTILFASLLRGSPLALEILAFGKAIVFCILFFGKGTRLCREIL
jgi:hypothetical protein